MSRRRYQDDISPKTRIITIIVIIWIFAFIGNALTNPDKASALIGYTILALLIYFGIRFILKTLEKKRVDALLQSLKRLGLEEYIENFINRFSFEGKNIDGWEFRNHRIDWDRIDDLEKYLIEKDIDLETTKKHRDVLVILRFYIQKQEEDLTRESISKKPQKYALLSGTDFEMLLYRLFIAMGYVVEHVGRSGDQGGDLVANKNGERTLIQAKCYRDWSVGNEAVQQVVGAMQFYNCHKTMVITTSSVFTPEAQALAKSNNTELISKDRLSELLMQYLNESWG